MKKNSYVVATIKPWNIAAFKKIKPELPGEWYLVTSKEELSEEFLREVEPRYIFFPHWSWIVPTTILEQWECVCFHMADVPYGRGGSPLQNLIALGHETTKLSALRMIDELDAGPVYSKIDLDLKGSAQNIFDRMTPKIYELITYIITHEPTPLEQRGDVTLFKRRTPSQSILPPHGDIKQLYDHIRMLDAETYPKAYITYGDSNIEFSNTYLSEDGILNAVVRITKI